MTSYLKIADAIASRAQAVGDKVAMTTADRATTFRSLWAMTAAAASELARDVGPGDRLAVLTRDPLAATVAVGAASCLGADISPLNVRLSGGELAAQLERLSPVVVIADREFAGYTRRTVPTHALVAEQTAAAELPAPDDVGLHGLGRHQSQLIIFTSGTSGQPKGALLEESAMLVNALIWSAVTGFGPDAAYGNGFPLFHVGGFIGLLPVLAVGATTHLPRVGGFDGRAFLSACDERAATHVGLVPSQLIMLAERGVEPRAGVRVVLTGGAPPTGKTLEAIRVVFPNARYINAYGQTELSGNVAYGVFDAVPDVPHIGTIQPFSFHRTETIDVGTELLVRSPGVFRGYLGAGKDEGDTDGAWHRTGDLVDEVDGQLVLTGRASEMIISGGENIRPAEVAEALAAHPAVAEAVVVGAPDERWGEVPVAFVTLAGQHGLDSGAPDLGALLPALRAHLSERVARYKVPRAIYVLGDLPRTGTAKVDVRQLRKLASDA